MWLADAFPAQEPPAIYVVAHQAVAQGAPHKSGACETVANEYASISPLREAKHYVSKYLHKYNGIYSKLESMPTKDIVLSILRQPKHGRLEQSFPESDDLQKYRYTYFVGSSEDDSGDDIYSGPDHFTIEVNVNGIAVEIQYTVDVLGRGQPETYIDDSGVRRSHSGACAARSRWRISLGERRPMLTVSFSAFPRDVLAQALGLG